MKIGMLGGSFNPIHMGHLMLADEARRAFALDTVLFVPAHISPFKRDVQTASRGHMPSDEERAEMIRAAIGTNSRFVLEPCELERGGVSYTIDTVRYLRKKYALDGGGLGSGSADFDCGARDLVESAVCCFDKSKNFDECACGSCDAVSSDLNDTAPDTPRDSVCNRADSGCGLCAPDSSCAPNVAELSVRDSERAVRDADSSLYLIIGDDLVRGFASWKCAAELSRETTIILARRTENFATEGFTTAGADERSAFAFPHQTLDNALLPISSTDIRARIKDGKSWRYLVPDSVYRYISERHLYEY